MKGFLPDQTRPTQVRLRTANLAHLLSFYQNVLGLAVLQRTESEAMFGCAQTASAWLRLSEAPNATPHRARSTGLYHFAIRYPQRKDLARAYARVLGENYPITGASDHNVSEAIYLSDPDNNGVELYADRPRSKWTWQTDQVLMSTTALDLDDLLATIADEPDHAKTLAQSELGHIHLHVADLVAAERFYSEFIGLAVTQRSYPGALFFAAGGYHHHIAANTWVGKKLPQPNAVGLISYRLEVPVKEVLYCLSRRAPLLGYEARFEGPGTPLLQIRDPNGNWLEIQSSADLGSGSPGLGGCG